MKVKKIALTLPAPVCIVACISLFITYINQVPNQPFLMQWCKVFVFSLLIIMPIAGVLIMTLAKVVERTFPELNALYQKLLLCALIALSLESIMSLVSTLSMSPAHNLSQFVSFWWFTLLKALPLGYVIAMIMVFIIKPKIQRALASA